MKQLEVDAVPLAGTVLVEASAGTGKTFTLSHLYLRALVELRLEPREVLVVTYTKAATAELRTRIRQRLRAARAALAGELADDAILAGWAGRRRSQGTAERDAAHLLACLHELDTAAIHTIHAFAQRALREAAFASGADFDAEVLEDLDPLVERIARDYWARQLFDAEPVAVAYLQEEARLRAGDLARLGRRILQQPAIRILPDEIPIDPGAGARYASLAADWAASWLRWRGEVRDRLLHSDALKRNRYRGSSIRQWCEALDVEATREHPAPSWRVKAFDRFTPQRLREGCKIGCEPPDHPFFALCADLVRAQAALQSWALGLKRQFARELGPELARRLGRSGLRSFGDLITGLRDALRDDRGALAARLRERFRLALVDESQDTDPVQVEIFRRVWGEAGLALFWIGDPKQAIYAFRGADVHAYLAAGRESSASYTLEHSWRSDPALLRALDALLRLRPGPFELEAIAYRPLLAREGARDWLDPPALELWIAPQSAAVGAPESTVCRAVAGQITALLATPPSIGGVRLAARDVAVLCRTNAQARCMRDALRARGVPAVLHGDESVLQPAAALDVERIARALAHPGDAALLRGALATRLVGLDARELDSLAGDGARLESALEAVQRAHQRWIEDGFVVALRALLDELDASARLLAEPGGERELTDALHVAELAHLAARQLHLGPGALCDWLAAERRGDGHGGATLVEDAQLRLESDGDAVQLTTVHRSKGLEYGVVYLPFAWGSDRLRSDDELWPRFHEGDALVLDLAAGDSSQARAAAEARAEAMRLLYVGLTRARHRCSVVFAATDSSHESALGRLLGCRKGEDGSALQARLAAALPGDAIAVRLLEPGAEPPAVAPPEPAHAGAPRRLLRTVARARRTSSFTALVRHAPDATEGRDHDAHLALDPEGLTAPGPFPAGAAIGLALHEVLEGLDFARADLDAVHSAVERAGELHGIDASHQEALARCVLDALDTPLPPDGALRLRDVPLAERSAELEFLLPVGDPRDAARWLAPARLAEPFARHAERAPLRRYAERVRRLGFPELAGHLRGFVDLVFRRGGRWFLVDYKSNDLGAADAYAPDRLAAPMREHDYLLQYHLYTVALHRWLARRVPGYDYGRDFGGVYYLFLRGMGPRQPPGWGVWFDRPPLALVEALSSALERPGERAA